MPTEEAVREYLVSVKRVVEDYGTIRIVLPADTANGETFAQEAYAIGKAQGLLEAADAHAGSSGFEGVVDWVAGTMTLEAYEAEEQSR